MSYVPWNFPLKLGVNMVHIHMVNNSHTYLAPLAPMIVLDNVKQYSLADSLPNTPCTYENTCSVAPAI